MRQSQLTSLPFISQKKKDYEVELLRFLQVRVAGEGASRGV